MRGNNSLLDFRDVAAPVIRGVARSVRGVAFWTAALLPFLYLPVLLADPALLSDVTLLGKLIVLNTAALVVGHGYGTTGR
jgi:hypothetical protein